MIDTHAHLTKDAYPQLEPVLERSRQAGVDTWITIGTALADDQEVVEMTRHHEGLFASVGIHPHHAATAEGGWQEELGRLAREDRVVALGETGLDYHYDFSPRNVQQKVFEQQLGLAEEVNVPIVVHCREALDDCLGILDGWGRGAGKVLFHSFSQGPKEARMILDRGFFLSFSGMITFKKAEEIQAAAVYAPLDRILLETDCPFLSPEPKRNVRPNEPALLMHTVGKLAQLRQTSLEEIAQVTSHNGRCFFRLNGR